MRARKGAAEMTGCGFEMHGAFPALSADDLVWVLDRVLELGRAHPDAEVRVVLREKGVTVQVWETQPFLLSQYCTGIKGGGEGGE
jgi:hypothetical protein